MAETHVHYVGQPVAFVVAETYAQAIEGAEAIAIEFEHLTPTVTVDEAADQPLFTHTRGDEDGVAEIIRQAPVVVEFEAHIPRLVAASIETRGYIGRYDAKTSGWTLIANAGRPHAIRDVIATQVLHVAPAAVRLIAPDIGGGFGAKNAAHAEAALCLWAAQRVRRPVCWIGTRTESFLSDMQGRDHTILGKLALDKDGRFLALSHDARINLGAYLATRAISPCLNGMKVVTGAYHIESAFARVRGFLTNTVPTCPYRGAGAPETAFIVERLIDIAAKRMVIDPAELRRRNLLRPDQLPWQTPFGVTMHSVNFPAVLDRAIELSGWKTRDKSTPRGSVRRGHGIAFTIEGYDASFDETAEMLLDARGQIEIRIGTKSGGQSHETTYVQLAADALGLPMERITILQGDTGRIARGNGTAASRSLTTGGSAILKAAASLLEAGRQLAATQLQCKPDELQYRQGRFETSGPLAASIDLAALAKTTASGTLHVSDAFRPDGYTFPGGCHIATVDVDVDTGAVTLVSYHAVHDAGVVVNPTVVEGQLHGAIVQGVGAALMERATFDSEGQALTASFQDYAMPHAHNISAITVALCGTRCASNLIGAKPVGEAGTVAAPPALINAIVDAIGMPDIDHIDLPATPQAIWQAIANADAD